MEVSPIVSTLACVERVKIEWHLKVATYPYKHGRSFMLAFQ